MNYMTTTITVPRPPRPHIPSPEVLAVLAEHGWPHPEQIADAWVSPEGDVVFDDLGGNRYRIVGEACPDGAGRTGPLVEHTASGKIDPARQTWFTPRSTDEPWTLADLDWLAGKIRIPAATGADDGFSGYRQWLTDGMDTTTGIPTRQPGEPNHQTVRAYALWKHWTAERWRGLSMVEAAKRSELCARLQREVLGSGWLAEDEAAKLR